MSKADEIRAKAARLNARKQDTGESQAPAPEADKPTEADKKRHLAPVASAPKAVPVRSTVDLPPVQHAKVKAWCAETAVEIGQTRVTTQDLVKTLLARLLTDETLARKVRDDLRHAAASK